MIFAVGDIHGKVELLRTLLSSIEEYSKTVDEEHTIVFLGDYIDRGEHSKEVLDILMDEPIEGFNHVFLRGNHEQMMLEYLNDDDDDGVFLYNGGKSTMESFGTKNPKDSIFDEYKIWLESTSIYYETDGFFFVHAGVDPLKDTCETDTSVFLWIRRKFLSHREPFYSNGKPKIIVHGHTHTHTDKMYAGNSIPLSIFNINREIPLIYNNRINVDTGSYWTNTVSAIVISGNKLIGYITSDSKDFVKVDK